MLLLLESAEVLKIGFYPNKLLASTKCLKSCDLIFGSVPRPFSMRNVERQNLCDDQRIGHLHDFANFPFTFCFS